MNDILWTQVMQILVPFLATAISVVAGAVGLAARRYLGDRATEILRAGLHDALNRALSQAVATGSDTPELDAVDYIQNTMGGTIKRLNASTNGLFKRAKAQLLEQSSAGAPDETAFRSRQKTSL
jgi:hypothetical protein